MDFTTTTTMYIIHCMVYIVYYEFSNTSVYILYIKKYI